MALEAIGRPANYMRVRRRLRVEAHGTPFRNLRFLEQLGVSVETGSGSLDVLRAALARDLPLIVAVDTRDLPYWHDSCWHAVVVVGLDEERAYINDPAFADAPQIVSMAWFELAWLERDYLYGIIDN